MLKILGFAIVAVIAQTGGSSGPTPSAPSPASDLPHQFTVFVRDNLLHGLTCHLDQKDIFVSGKCDGYGFARPGLAYGIIDGSRFHLSVYLERLNDTKVSFDLMGDVPHNGVFAGTMLTTDGTNESFQARMEIPYIAPAPRP
jgi:hypothetical protein